MSWEFFAFRSASFDKLFNRMLTVSGYTSRVQKQFSKVEKISHRLKCIWNLIKFFARWVIFRAFVVVF